MHGGRGKRNASPGHTWVCPDRRRRGGPCWGGGGRGIAVGRGIAGAERVVAPVGGTGGRVGAGAGRVTALPGGIGGRVGAGAWGMGAATLCDRSLMAAFIG